jgi:hypothetical protein
MEKLMNTEMSVTIDVNNIAILAATADGTVILRATSWPDDASDEPCAVILPRRMFDAILDHIIDFKTDLYEGEGVLAGAGCVRCHVVAEGDDIMLRPGFAHPMQPAKAYTVDGYEIDMEHG